MARARLLCGDCCYEKGSVCIRADVRTFDWAVRLDVRTDG